MNKLLRNQWKALLVLIMSVGLLSQANAHDNHRNNSYNKRVKIDFHHLALKGNNTILLKKKIKHRYPHIDLRNYTIKKVVLNAKTKYGKGYAKLRVGNHYSHSMTVDGHPKDFHHNHRHSYDRVVLNNPKKYSKGQWQIYTTGNFKVKSAIVVLEAKPHRRHKNNHEIHIY